MATYSLGSAGNIDDLDSIKKVQDYLIKLDRNLKYMFNNLDPEDNYSEAARLIMVADGERQATIETTLQGISLNYVSKDGVVSAINLSEENIQIKAEKIKLEGAVTVNGRFKVGLDGSIEATNGKFNGDITASKIYGSHIYGSYIGTTDDNFFVLADEDENDVAIGLGDGFSYEAKKLRTSWIGSVENPALGTDQAGINGNTGDAGFRRLYLLDGSVYSGWSLSDILARIEQRIDDIDDGGGGGGGGDGGDVTQVEPDAGGDGGIAGGDDPDPPGTGGVENDLEEQGGGE